MYQNWKEQRIRIEQKTLCKSAEMKLALSEVLQDLKRTARSNQWQQSHCFISYAWPHANYPEEAWLQEFLIELNQHLIEAGIVTRLDRRNNLVGGSVYGFIEQLKKSENVIILGSQALLLKHRIGKSNICAELNEIRHKPTSNIFPILLTGCVKTSFPEWFEGYTNIVDWRDESYIFNLKELLRALYKLEPDDTNFNSVWDTFEKKYPELSKGLQKIVIDKLLAEETATYGKEVEKSYDFVSSKLQRMQSGLHPTIVKNVSRQKKILISLLTLFLGVLFVSFVLKSPYHLKSASINTITNRGLIPEIHNPVKRMLINEIYIKSKKLDSNIVYIAITGFSGTGKTVLAQSYVDTYLKTNHQAANTVCWFLRSENQHTLQYDYLELAEKLGIKLDAETSFKTLAKEVSMQLIKKPGFILVFDNVNHYEDIEQFLPSNPEVTGKIILTSQQNDILPIDKKLSGFSISLNKGMTERESIELFSRLMGKEVSQEAKMVFERFEGLPLALVQVAGFISKTKMSFTDYLTLYETHYDKIFSKTLLPETYQKTNNIKKNNRWLENTYNTVIGFSLNKLSMEAEQLFRLTAYLAPDNIPIELFHPLGLSIEKLHSVLAELEQSSLITLDPTSQHFSVHRVIQDVNRHIIKEEHLIDNQEERCIDKVLELLHKQHRLNVVTEHDYYAKRTLIPHFEKILMNAPYPKINSEIYLKSMVDLALLHKAIGNAKISSDYYKKVLPFVVNREADWVAELYKGLGRAYQATGEFEKAKPAFEQAFMIYHKIHQEPSAEKAGILDALGMIYRDLGYELQKKKNANAKIYFLKAKAYLIQAVEMSEPLANENKNRVRYLTNLGEIYRNLGDLNEAELALQRALKVGKAEFPSEKHRLMSYGYYILGQIKLDQKEFDNAKWMFEKAIKIGSDESVVGKNHPFVARQIDALGTVWRALQNEQQACLCFKDANKILEASNRGQAQLRQVVREHVDGCL